MPQSRKIATCCYCGTRAVLVLDRGRHELACAACGAPLHEMKNIPVVCGLPKARGAAPVGSHPRPRRHPGAETRSTYKKKDKRRKRKPLSGRLIEELWDVFEDIFD